MSTKTTKIEWTDKTWNPIIGCTKISQGCAHCYAEVMTRRLNAMGLPKYADGFKVSLHEDCLAEPLEWKQPHTIFVCSMSDIFHKDVPFDFVDKIMAIIEKTPQHRYQILTKRAERMAEYFSTRKIPQNAWLGVTVEAQSSKNRIDCLRQLAAPIRFLSCEPLLEDLGELNLQNIDWVIVGGKRHQPCSIGVVFCDRKVYLQKHPQKVLGSRRIGHYQRTTQKGTSGTERFFRE